MKTLISVQNLGVSFRMSETHATPLCQTSCRL